MIKWVILAGAVGAVAYLYVRSRRGASAQAGAGGGMVPDRGMFPAMPHAEADRINRASLASGGPVLVVPQRVTLPGTAPNFANMSAAEIRAWVDANRAIASKWTTAEKSELSRILRAKSATPSTTGGNAVVFA